MAGILKPVQLPSNSNPGYIRTDNTSRKVQDLYSAVLSGFPIPVSKGTSLATSYIGNILSKVPRVAINHNIRSYSPVFSNSLVKLTRGVLGNSAVNTESDIPFRGREFFEGSIDLFSPHTTNNWCITIQPFQNNPVPPNPYLGIFPDNWIPALSFDYDQYKMETEPVEIGPGLQMDLPGGISINNRLNITILEDSTRKIYNYLKEYTQAMVQDYRRVLPYQECCSEIDIYVYTRSRDILERRTLLGYPNINQRLEGSDVAAIETITTEWIIVGELT